MRRPIHWLLAALFAAVYAPGGGAGVRVGNLEVAGPDLARTEYRPGDPVTVSFTIRNHGFRAPIEAFFEVRGPNDQPAYSSRYAPGLPGRSLRIERGASANVAYFFPAPREPGTYRCRLRVRNRYSNRWQVLVPTQGWSPLFEVAGEAAGGWTAADTVFVALSPRVQAGEQIRFQLRGSGVSVLVERPGARIFLRVRAAGPGGEALAPFRVEEASPAMVQFRGVIPPGAAPGRYTATALFGEALSLAEATFDVEAPPPVELGPPPPAFVAETFPSPPAPAVAAAPVPAHETPHATETQTLVGLDTGPPPEPGSVQEAVALILAGLKGEDIDAVMSMTASDYHGASEGGADLDRSLLRRSLDFDIAQAEGMRISARITGVEAAGGETFVSLAWSVKYIHAATGAEIEEKDRATRLAFRRIENDWRLFGQTGMPLLGRSDPLTGRFEPPAVRAAIERKRLEEEARLRAEQLAGTGAETAAATGAWSVDDFTAKVQEATEAIISGYQNEDEGAIMARISPEYRGVDSRGGNVDYYTLPASLQCDFQIFDGFTYSAASESFRVFPQTRQAEVILYWDARARYLANNTDIVKKARRTRLLFVDEGGEAKLLQQDIASLSNGTVLVGRASPSSCLATLRADEGSTSGTGIQVAGGSSAAGSGAGSFEIVPTEPFCGTLTQNRTISQDTDLTCDVTIPAGVTVTVNPGVTITATGYYRIEIAGRLDASNATFRSSSGTPGAWWGLRFQSGSSGTLSSITVRDGVDGIRIDGGSPTITSPTLTNNTDGFEIVSGTLTLSSPSISANSSAGVNIVGGDLTISGGTVQSNSVNEIRGIGGTLTMTGGLTVDAASQAHQAVFADNCSVTTTGIVTLRGAGGGFGGLGLQGSGTHTLGSGFISTSNDNGLGILNATVTINGSNISGNTTDGIRVENGGSVVASGATFSNNGNLGIRVVSGGSASLTNCTISDNGTMAVQITGGDVTIDGGTVSQSAGSSGVVTGTGGTLTLRGGAVVDAMSGSRGAVVFLGTILTTTGAVTVRNATGSTGLFLSAGNHSLGSGLTVSNNDWGIACNSGANVTASGISVVNNAVDGVIVQAGTTFTATAGTSISFNGSTGLNAGVGGNISITNCNFQGNSVRGVWGNGTSATASGWYMSGNNGTATYTLSTAIPTDTGPPGPQYSGMTSISSPRSTPN